MIIDVLTGDLALTNPGGNYTANGYPTRIPKIARPDQVTAQVTSAGDGVVTCGLLGSITAQRLLLIPIGVGSATNTFGMKILGWSMTNLGIPNVQPLWIPEELVTYAVVLGSAAGVTGAELTSATLFATTITSTGGPTFITSGAPPVSLDWFQISPGSNAIGIIMQPTFGHRFIEVVFTTGGSATSCNCLYRKAG